MNWRRLLDVLAIAVLLGYVWLAQETESGAADPVWQRIQARGTIIVGTDIGFAPFVYQQPDGTMAGYDVELVNEIASRLGLDVEWQQVGYDALWSTVDPGNPNQVDLLAAGIALNPMEGWRARFTNAYFDNGPQLVVHPAASYTSQADFHDATIAVQLGSPGETSARQLVAADPSLSIDNTFYTQDEAMQAVIDGRADAAVVENVVALQYINREQIRRLASLEFEPYVYAMPVAAYQLNAEFNRILEQLNQEGWIADLNQRTWR